MRGSAEDRRRRRAWLLLTFSPDLGPALARCELTLVPECLQVVDVVTLSVDRIVPGGPYTRDNVQPACGPCQDYQGGIIGSSRRGVCPTDETLFDVPDRVRSAT